MEEGKQYFKVIKNITGICELIVSKRWGFHAIVVEKLSEYFYNNGTVADGGCVLLSPNDFLGTTVIILNGEEFRTLEKYAIEKNLKGRLFEAYGVRCVHAEGMEFFDKCTELNKEENGII